MLRFLAHHQIIINSKIIFLSITPALFGGGPPAIISSAGGGWPSLTSSPPWMVHKRLGCISTSTTLQLQLTTVITSTVILLYLPAALIHHHVAPDHDCHRAVQPARHAYATGFQNSHKYLPQRQIWYMSILRTCQAMQHIAYEKPFIRPLLPIARRL